MTGEYGDSVSSNVQSLYDTAGWTMVGDVTYDAATGEDLRPVAAEYVSACRLRVLAALPRSGDKLLDMASGPIQYPEYFRYSEHFKTRVCVDLSQRALDMAKAKLGDRGEYRLGDFIDMDMPEGYVDSAVSLHTIYHIDKTHQETAVRKMVHVVKPGGVIVIVYSNPAYFVSALLSPIKRLLVGAPKTTGESPDTIYFHRYPLSWWRRFSDVGAVEIHPWRTFGTREQKALFPSGALGRQLFRWLWKAESLFPRFFTAIGCYPMIVIRKPAAN